MGIRSVRGSLHKRSPDHQLTKIQTPGQFRLALEWRDDWRAEKFKGLNGTASPVPKEKDKDKARDPDKDRRQRFAEGMARAELGRAYWDARRHRDVQQRPGRNGKAKGSPPGK